MRDANKYNGNQVVIHKVKHGENLSLIARRYRFKSFEPIWIYNTQVHSVLGSNPDLIQEGAEIFIPRSERGYHRLITGMKALQMHIQYSCDQDLGDFEKDYNLALAHGVRLDAIGDALTFVTTIGLQAVRAAQTAATAAELVGQDRVAGEYLAHKACEELRKTLIGKAKDVLVDAVASKKFPKKQDEIKGAYHARQTGTKAIHAIEGFSMKGGKALLDVSEMVLDWITPSNAANAWLALIGVGTLKKALKTNSETKKAVANSVNQMHAKILHFEEERDTLYASDQPNPTRPHLRPGHPLKSSAKPGQIIPQQKTNWSEFDKAIAQDDRDLKQKGLDDFLKQK